MDLRVRKAALQKGAKVIRIASAERPYPAPIPSTDVATVAEAIKKLPKDPKRIAIVWDGCDADFATSLLEKLPAGAQVLTYITGEQANARGAEAMGMLPFSEPGYGKAESGLDAAQMFAAARDGKLAVLSIFGANPAMYRADFARASFTAVSDLFMTETAQLADLVLPAKGPFEKTGTTTNMAGDVLPVNAAHSLETPADALSDLEMVVALAEKLGVELPVAEEVDAAVLRHLAKAPEDFTLGDARFGTSVILSPSKDPERRRKAHVEGIAFNVVVQTRVFGGGGTSAHDARIAELCPLPEAAFSPEDAAELGVNTGDYIDLVLDSVSDVVQAHHDNVGHDLLVEVRNGMPRGTIALIGGLPDSPASNLAGARVSVTNIRRAPEDAAEAIGAPA